MVRHQLFARLCVPTPGVRDISVDLDCIPHFFDPEGEIFKPCSGLRAVEGAVYLDEVEVVCIKCQPITNIQPARVE